MTHLRVNVQLVSAETGVHLWSDRFNEEISQLAVGQQQIIARMYDTIGFSMVDIEAARSLRERPTNPDAFDLILQARSMRLRPQRRNGTRRSWRSTSARWRLIRHRSLAMTGVAYQLIDWRPPGGWGSFENMERAGQLLAQARALEPRSPRVLDVALYWLRSVGRCAEVIETAEHAIRIDPNRTRSLTGLYNELAVCKTRKGHAEEELGAPGAGRRTQPAQLFQVQPLPPHGLRCLMLGRDQDAIGFLSGRLPSIRRRVGCLDIPHAGGGACAARP